jgi:hypothetical protein
MKFFASSLACLLLCSALLPLSVAQSQESPGDWVTLFDGTDLEGWESNEETADVFTVEDGTLKVAGGRAHLFYMGTGGDAPEFQDFVLQARVKTTAGSNSGIFFHTAPQAKGWPEQGFEAQVNSTHRDRRKTGSIYGVQDVRDDAPSTDEEWFDYEIRVEGDTITTRINGEIAAQWTQPADWTPPGNMPGRKIGSGTFAIQGHDPRSVVYFDDIKVKRLD